MFPNGSPPVSRMLALFPAPAYGRPRQQQIQWVDILPNASDKYLGVDGLGKTVKLSRTIDHATFPYPITLCPRRSPNTYMVI